jgi:AraC-like DNA-binding protein
MRRLTAKKLPFLSYNGLVPAPPMRSQLVAPALALVREAGGEVGPLLRDFSLPKTVEKDAEVTLPLDRLRAFLDAAALAAKDPFLGLHIAQNIRRGAYGLLEFACRSAPDVGEALRRIVRYISLTNELVEVSLVEGNEAIIEQKIPGQPLCVGRHGNEFFVAMLLGQARQLTGRRVLPTRVWFAHPPPRDRSALVELAGDRIEFDREKNGMALPRTILAAPLSSHDPALLDLLDQQAEAALRLRASPSRFLGQVRQQIRDALRDGVPSLEDAAHTLHMSARTLQRRLSEEDTTYLALVDDVRQELARRWVSERPLGEIAFLLGYSELSAFLRAFKRWTGSNVSNFRVARAVSKSGARGHRAGRKKGVDRET